MTAACTCLPKLLEPIAAQALTAIEKLKGLSSPSSCLPPNKKTMLNRFHLISMIFIFLHSSMTQTIRYLQQGK
jgi:hypothetical protein